jgi:hypothetical protein
VLTALSDAQVQALIAQAAALSPAEREALKREVDAEQWRRGELRFRLDATQQKIYDNIKAAPKGRYFLNCSRRLGKSYTMLAVAAELCIKEKHARVVYVAPAAKDAAKIATDNWIALSENCPKALKIEYKAQAGKIIFPLTDSEIEFRATNGEHARNLRGGRADLAILDEAGEMDNFENALLSIIEPMTASTGTRPKGRILIATTPAETLGHDSHKVYMDYASKGAVAEFTLNDNPRIPYEEKVEMLERYGEAPDDIPLILSGKILPKTTRAKREYYCQWVTEAHQAVVPEYAASHDPARPHIFAPLPAAPPFRHCFVGMDPGMKDNTGIIFAYWDWLHQRLVIEDEWMAPMMRTGVIAKVLADTEERLWQHRHEVQRVCDTDLRLIQDLTRDYNLPFVQANKKDRMASIMLMRQYFQDRRILIAPNCKNLDRQLQNAIHNRRGNDFERDGSSDGIDGHYDLVAALYYLIRYVDTRKTTNPYPSGWLPRRFDEQTSVKDRLGVGRRENRGIYDDTPLGRRLSKRKAR